MGTPVPEDLPELIDGKYYCVTEQNHWDGNWDPGCRGTPTSTVKCCRTGAAIKAYLEAGNECHYGVYLCVTGYPQQKKVICVTGPYDTQGECQAEL